jgi:hypothetical protein
VHLGTRALEVPPGLLEAPSPGCSCRFCLACSNRVWYAPSRVMGDSSMSLLCLADGWGETMPFFAVLRIFIAVSRSALLLAAWKKEGES